MEEGVGGDIGLGLKWRGKPQPRSSGLMVPSTTRVSAPGSALQVSERISAACEDLDSL
jgi:hypothetical protein